MPDLRLVQNHLSHVLHHLQPLLQLANCHMVNFLTGKFWNNFTPDGIKNEYEAIGLSGMYKILWHFTKSKTLDCEAQEIDALRSNCPNLCNYFLTAGNICLSALEEVSLSHEMFQMKLKLWGYNRKADFSIKEFMSQKKLHEVQMMSQVVAAMSTIANCSVIIDVGGGKGYLSSMLALHHGLKVLGVDSSHINTHGAAKRTEKLQKYWPGLCRRAAEVCKSTTTRRGKHWKSKTGGASTTDSSADEAEIYSKESERIPNTTDLKSHTLYKQITMHVTEQSDVCQLVEDNFPNCSADNLALVGLHTCGNLAATCLKLFVTNKSIKAMCNVGCCYHLIEEEFCVNPFKTDQSVLEESSEYGFPMSDFLCSKEFALGRNARMLAAQPVDRLSKKDEIPVKPLFYRALLQVLLTKKFGCGDRSDWQVGRIANKCKNFSEYAIKSAKRLNIDLEMGEEALESFYEEYLGSKDELEAFFLLRVALAPIIETVILLDRLLYLLEQGVNEVNLVQLFDPVISPRCYGLIALKDVPHFSQ